MKDQKHPENASPDVSNSPLICAVFQGARVDLFV